MGGNGQDRKAGIVVMRRTARIMGTLVAGFFLFMFLAESWGHWRGLLDIKPLDKLMLGMMGVYILGMFLALKWERAGALVGLGAYSSFFILLGFKDGGKFLLNPFLAAFWIPILLYLACWVFGGGQRENAGRSAAGSLS